MCNADAVLARGAAFDSAAFIARPMRCGSPAPRWTTLSPLVALTRLERPTGTC